MARKPDHLNKKKRTKTVLLSEKTYLMFREIKRVNPKWSFSGFVNDCLSDKLRGVLPQEFLLRQAMLTIQKKRDEDYDFQTARLKEVVSALNEHIDLIEKTSNKGGSNVLNKLAGEFL